MAIEKVIDDFVEMIDGKERSPYENQREILEAANMKLKNLWDLFGKEKAKLLREDKNAVYRALKNVQSRLNDEWDKFKKIQAEISAKSRDKVVGMARAAIPPTSFEKAIETAILAYLTKGLSLLLEFCDNKESELQVYNARLKEAWNCFQKEKIKLLRHDKEIAYNALKEAEYKLNAAWAEFKGQKQKAQDQYYQAKRERHQAWRSKVQHNLEGNRQRYSKLEGVLEHKRAHLNELYEKHNDARSDSYRELVEGWIEEELRNIQDIEEKMTDIDGWIREDESKLNS